MEEVSNGDFQNYPTGGSRNSLSIYNHTTGGTYSQLLNGGNNSQIGLAKSYKVYPGDKVKIEAYGKYANPTSNSSNVSAFASALLNAFLLPTPVAGELGTASSALNSWGSVVAAGGDGQSNAAPHVSVNIILFDKNYNFLDAAYDQIAPGAQQVGVTPIVAHDYMTKEYTVKEEGYVFMYIANENQTQVDAYFDDVAMTYTPTNIVQYNEYYPFGLQTSTSWTRDNNNNNYLYNAGNELNATTGWYDLAFRNYDPSIGRFMQVDPLAHLDHSVTPFAYGGNNPVLFNDPSGLLADSPADRTMRRRDEALDPGYWSANGDGATWASDAGGGGYRETTINITRTWLPYTLDPNNGFWREEFDISVDGLVDDRGGEDWVQDASQDMSLILNFSGADLKMPSGSQWLLRDVHSMEEAALLLNALNSQNRKINNLILVGHGNVDHMSLGKDADKVAVNLKTKKITSMENLRVFNSILEEVASGGNVFITSCYADNYLGPVLQNFVRNDLNIFMNYEYTRMSKTILFGQDLSDTFFSIRNITRDPTGVHLYENISLNKNGTFNFGIQK